MFLYAKEKAGKKQQIFYEHQFKFMDILQKNLILLLDIRRPKIRVYDVKLWTQRFTINYYD